jgi:hypothetical protein
MTDDQSETSTEQHPVVQVLHEIAEEKGSCCTRDKLCVEDHSDPRTAKICLPAGGHEVLKMIAERGLRVSEIPKGRPDCHRAGHHKRIYVRRDQSSIGAETDGGQADE